VRSFNLLKSKIKKYINFIIIFFIFLFILDLGKINYKFENIRLITFDSLNLSLSLNKIIYQSFDKVYTKILLQTSKHKIFWEIDKSDRSKIAEKLKFIQPPN